MKVLVYFLSFLVTVYSNAVPQKNKIHRSANIYLDPVALPDETPSLKIIDGKESIPHSIPYQVYIYFEGFLFTWSCGGTLIKPRFVLTAAHCLDFAEVIQVTLGAHNVTKKETSQIVVNGIKWKQHEQYMRKFIIYDIGLIELEHPVYPNEDIAYAQLPSETDFWQSYEGFDARVSGWGYTSRGLDDREETDVLREVTSTIIDNESCDEFFDVVVERNEICISGAAGKGACNGDSGGPLVIRGVQQGIVSYGARGCLYGYPTVFCRVSHFLPWITENTHDD